MAFVLSDRIKETTTTTSTGTYTLGGAVSGFETFTANLSNGDTTYYCCTDGTDFEVGLGTFASSGTTLARTTIISSSNSNNAVNWSSGSRDIFCTLPGSKAAFKDGSDNINGTFVGNITGNVTGNTSGTAATVTGAAQSNITSVGTLTGLTTSGAINLSQTSGTAITTSGALSNADLGILRAHAGGDTHGFTIKYMGSRSGNNNSYSLFMDNQSGTDVEAMTVFQDGKVGINNTSPSARLDVVGDVELVGDVTGLTSLTVDDITINSSTISDGGDMLLDAGGDLLLDAAGNDIRLKADGTEFGRLSNSSSDFVIRSSVADKDIILRGVDGSSAIDALTFDMSNAGAATFNDKITAVGTSVFTNLDISGDVDIDGTLETDALSIASTTVTATAEELNYTDVTTLGTVEASKVVTADANGDIIFTGANANIVFDKSDDSFEFADDAKITFGGVLEIFHDGNNNFIKDGGTGNLRVLTNEFRVKSANDNENIIRGNQNGSVILYHNNNQKLETTTTGIDVTGDLTTSADIELGHASDTTIARASAGVVTIEGNTVLTTGNSDTPTTTTSSSDADFVLVDDGGTMKKITPSNLGITSGGASKGFAVAMAIAL